MHKDKVKPQQTNEHGNAHHRQLSMSGALGWLIEAIRDVGSALLPNLYALAAIGVSDHLALKPWLKGKGLAGSKLTTTRWFFTHFVANAAVCISAAKALYITFTGTY